MISGKKRNRYSGFLYAMNVEYEVGGLRAQTSKQKSQVTQLQVPTSLADSCQVRDGGGDAPQVSSKTVLDVDIPLSYLAYQVQLIATYIILECLPRSISDFTRV